MGSLFRPKVPAPPPLPDPPEPDFSYEDQARQEKAENYSQFFQTLYDKKRLSIKGSKS